MDDRGNRISLIIEIIILSLFCAMAVFWASGSGNEQQAHASVNASHAQETHESETRLTREEADVLDARNGTGRWSECDTLPPVTPDHIDQEKIDDEISENFDLMCDVVFAESGNQGEHGMRLVADVIINRMRCGEAFDDTLDGVLMAPNQFSCVSDGGAARWNGHSMDNVRKICQEELTNVTDPTIFYFRTGHYTPYGVDAYKYGDHYFSRRK